LRKENKKVKETIFKQTRTITAKAELAKASSDIIKSS